MKQGANKESVVAKDSFVWKLEVDAIIFRNELAHYMKRYLNDGSEKTLIFVFIMLQIYLESFLHQNMRRITTHEFKNSKEDKYKKWINPKFEKRYIEEKLPIFLKNFSLGEDDNTRRLTEEILNSFGKISKIRNLLIHGHEVSISGNADSSNIEISEARGLLSKHTFKEVVDGVNLLGERWNKILEQVQSQCVALNSTEDYKFKEISIDRDLYQKLLANIKFL